MKRAKGWRCRVGLERKSSRSRIVRTKENELKMLEDQIIYAIKKGRYGCSYETLRTTVMHAM